MPKLKLKIKVPKFKAPKLKFKAPKLKLKIKAPNFSKMAKGLVSPFEDIGRSLTGLSTGLLDQVGASAGQLVDQVGQAAGEMAPDLLKAGANLLAPGAGSLLDMVPGLSNLMPKTSDADPSSSLDRQYNIPQMPSYSQATEAANIATIPPANQESDLMKYAPWAIGGLAVVYLMTQGKKR